VFQTTFPVSGICFAVSGILRFAAWFLRIIYLIINIPIRTTKEPHTVKPSFCLAACAVLLAACSPEPAAEKTVSVASQATPASTLTVPTARGDAVVPKNPERVAVYDWAALDTLTELGVDVGATTAPVRVDYLQPAFDKAATVGTLFEPDYEALHRYNPQLVITGGPGAEAYEQLAKNATTIDLTVDNGNIRTSGEKQMETLARIFGKEARAAELKAQIDALFAQTREAAKDKGRGLVLSVTGNKVSAFGTQSRLASWIHGDIGLPPVDESLRNEGHGQPVSFEYIKEKNPDWIFIIDRTAAIGQEGPAAVEVLDNALVRGTNAWKRKQIIVMPAANYIVAGGARQLIQAAEQLEAAFEKAEPVSAGKE
jgi:ferric enterobactin transporter binding protein